MPDFWTNDKSGYAELDMNTFCGWGAPLGWTLSERMRKALTPYDITKRTYKPTRPIDQRYFCSVHKIDEIDAIIEAISVKSHDP
jgi:hypothetical protein